MAHRKRSVSLVIEEPRGLLLVRRPDDDESLPGMWGLPAVSLAEDESEEEAVRRAGRSKAAREPRAGSLCCRVLLRARGLDWER